MPQQILFTHITRKTYHYCSCQIEWHERVTSQEEVVESDDVLEFVEHVAVPRDEPTQREDGAHARGLDIVAKFRIDAADQRQQIIEEMRGSFHRRIHEVAQVVSGKTVHQGKC